MTLNIAHRGARSLAPENTLAAARIAFELGADLWETDVAVTRDKALILFHDDTLTRTTDAAERFPDGAPWRVCDHTLSEVRSLDAGRFFVRDDPFGTVAAGAVKPARARSYAGEKVPTLPEALGFTKNRRWRVNLEIKPLPAPLADFPVVEHVLEAINRAALSPHQVVLSSFDHRLLRRAREIRPDIPLQALLNEGIEAIPASTLDEFPCWNLNHADITTETVAALIERGFFINLFTVNEAEAMVRYIAAGVSGIFTDFPQKLARIVASSSSP